MKIRTRITAGGHRTWQVDLGMVNGKRLRKNFRKRDLADAELAKHREQLKKSGEMGLAMTDEERLLFGRLKVRLAEVGATMEEAVNFFLKQAKPPRELLPFHRLLSLCLEAKEEEGLTPRYIRQLKSSVGSFAKAGYAEQLAHEITAEDLKGWLRGNRWAEKTWNNYLGDVRTVFEWGIQEGYVTQNPCEGVVRKKLVDEEIRFLSFADVQILLDRAAEWRPGFKMRDEAGLWVPYCEEDASFLDCLAAVVIGIFCGLRPEKELGEMEWEHERGDVVVVTAGRAKSRARRVVDLPENAREWLRLCPVREGKILPKNFVRKWKRLREACGLFQDWPHNAMRHTLATMHLAHFKDEKKLQLLLGHVDATLIYSNYRGLETPANAAKFWSLRPKLWGLALLLRPEG